MTTLPKGYLKAAFDEKTSVSSSALSARMLDELRHNLSMGEGAQSAGLMPTGYESKSTFTEQQKQKREKDFANLLHQLHMARLQLMQELIELQEAIEELTRKIEEKGRCIESIDACLKKAAIAGKFIVGEDGYPEDTRVKDLIKQWEKGNLKKWDCLDKNSSSEILYEIKREQETDKHEFESARTKKQSEWADKNEQLETLDETIAQIEQQGMSTRTFEKAVTLIETTTNNNQSSNVQNTDQTMSVKLDNLKM